MGYGGGRRGWLREMARLSDAGASEGDAGGPGERGVRGRGRGDGGGGGCGEEGGPLGEGARSEVHCA